MAESFRMYHAMGVAQGYPVTYPGFDEKAELPVGLNDNGTCKFVQFAVPKLDPVQSPMNTPAISLLTAITGTSGATGNNQSAHVSTTAYTGASGELWVIDPGMTAQEVIQPFSITDGTHFDATFMRNHSVGATLEKVSSSLTRFLDIYLDGITDVNGVGDIVIVRYSTLPAGVYDQIKLRGNTTTFAYVVDAVGMPWYSSGVEADSTTPIPNIPQYDDSMLDSNGIPTNGLVINAGPFAAGGSGGRVTPSPQIQYLFTLWPEPEIGSIYYRIYYRDL